MTWNIQEGQSNMHQRMHNQVLILLQPAAPSLLNSVSTYEAMYIWFLVGVTMKHGIGYQVMIGPAGDSCLQNLK